jgi:hypothetical protein
MNQASESEKKASQPILKVSVTCPECMEEVEIQELDKGRNEERVIECDFCEVTLKVPLILVKSA